MSTTTDASVDPTGGWFSSACFPTPPPVHATAEQDSAPEEAATEMVPVSLVVHLEVPRRRWDPTASDEQVARAVFGFVDERARAGVAYLLDQHITRVEAVTT